MLEDTNSLDGAQIMFKQHEMDGSGSMEIINEQWLTGYAKMVSNHMYTKLYQRQWQSNMTQL